MAFDILNKPTLSFSFRFHGIDFVGPILSLDPTKLNILNTPKLTPTPSPTPVTYTKVASCVTAPSLTLDGTLSINYKDYTIPQSSMLDYQKASLKFCYGIDCTITKADTNLILHYSRKFTKSEISNFRSVPISISIMYDGQILDSGNINSEIQVESLPPPTTKLKANLQVPISAKLGVPFTAVLSLSGKGSARCDVYVAPSFNGGTSFSSQGWYAPKISLVGGKSLKVKLLMTTNFKGIHGVFLYCTDLANGADLAYVLKKIVQN